IKFTQRLVFFNNMVFFFLWFCVLSRLLILLPLVGRKFLPGGISDFFHVVATISTLSEVLFSFSILKIRKSRIFFKIFKFLNLMFIIWVVLINYKRITRHWSYSLLIFSYSFDETINYFKFLFNLSWVNCFRKYKIFFIFPLQKFSEIVLLMLSLQFISNTNLADFIKALILFYFPYSYLALGRL
ncbi:Keg1p ASCRUDRAFT_27989, partial [Ascoidea rubescens DSM 1968]